MFSLNTYFNDSKALLLSAAPLMAAFFAQKGMQVIDTLMMGSIGPKALGAGALAGSVLACSLVFSMGVLSSVGVFASRAKGRGDVQGITRSVQAGFILAALLSIPAICALRFAPYFLLLAKQDPQVVIDATGFIHGLSWGIPGYLFFYVLRELISTFNRARAIMLTCLISIPLTAVLNNVFIYGLFGLPAMGVAGIGYANAFVMWTMFFTLLIYCKRHLTLKPYFTWLSANSMVFKSFSATKLSTLSFAKERTANIVQMLKIGLPSGLIGTLDVGLFIVAAMLVGQFGVNALAAHQVAMQCATMAFNVPAAIGMTTALQVSHAVGSNNASLAQRIAYTGLITGILLAAIIAVFFIFTPQWLSTPFTMNDQARYLTIKPLISAFLVAAGLFQCFDAIQTIMNGVLRGYKDTFIPMLNCLACFWLIGISAAYWLAFHTPLGAVGTWYGILIGMVCGGLSLFYRFKYTSKKFLLVSTY